MVRSLVVAVHALGCEEIFVIGHSDCGMAQIDAEKLTEHMISRGVPAEAINRLQPSFREWLGAFKDPRGNVKRVVQVLRDSPLIPNDIPVHGMIFHPEIGSLDVLTRGDAVAKSEG